MKLKIFFVVALIALTTGVQSQNYNNLSGQSDGINVITTAVPFLMIGPDARAGGMGDGGVASSGDVFSQHWNPAKYAWYEKKQGFGVAYTPWLRNLVPDINLAYVTYANRLDKMNTIAFSLRYFSLGEIQFTDESGMSLGYFKPNEFALDASYSRRLSDNFSLAVAGRFIYSNLTQGQTVQGVETTAGISIAADLGIYWQKEVNWFKTMDAEFSWGLLISNIGNKMSYTKSNIQRDFIPTNFRVGPRLTLFIDDYNKIAFQFDVNKLLVPTPPIYYREGDNYADGTLATGYHPDSLVAGMNPDVPVIRGMIQSWYDAPGRVVTEYDTIEERDFIVYNSDGTAKVEGGSAFLEELREFNFAVGAEYWYNNIFSIRAGYFWEHSTKGNRKYVTLGVGLRYNVFGLDFSYLIPTTGVENPLQNTLRFALIFNFGAAPK